MSDVLPASDPFKARQTLQTALGTCAIYRLDAVAKAIPGGSNISRLPYSIKVLLEACLRHCDGHLVTTQAVEALARFDPRAARAGAEIEVPFMPGRVLLQDFTGVPCVVDLAAMRDAMVRMGGDPRKVNPLVPCDLVIDHSVQVDAFASSAALGINSDLEFQRNKERYQFLKWGQQALSNFRVVPPATGIVHQVNLEYLAKVVWDKDGVLYPDSLVGTDSHTTMINGLGVLGWGVGGIEAEAVMLGQPIYMLIPEVVGVKLTGGLQEGCTATDLVLTVTQLLRRHGVVNKFVEFHGPGLESMSLANRATIANMAPEYGATCGFFPVDEQTLRYLRLTGRDEALVATVEQYCRAQGLWRDDAADIAYSQTLELDLATIEPSLAGPERPQDRVPLSEMQKTWRAALTTTFGKSPERIGGGGLPGVDPIGLSPDPAAVVAVAEEADPEGVEVEVEGKEFALRDGDVVIAAITSCTNTSNPDVMIAAGLVAEKAVAAGLMRKPWVKTSLAPGSKVVTDYLRKAELDGPLDALGFNLVGYGCTTCIGNSGPLPEAIGAAIAEGDLVVASVLSGNRNFEGRIHSDVKANYLASPPLVVAYALAGTVDIDLAADPLGYDWRNQPVYLHDIWPTQDEIDEAVSQCVTTEQFRGQYANVFEGSPQWRAIATASGDRYPWDASSTYIQNPPFFANLDAAHATQSSGVAPIRDARCLAKLGDSVTTDHISPAGSIGEASPAGKYLTSLGVAPADFNSYGSRRGNDRVMMRGTFANKRIRNQLAGGAEGGVTTDFLDGQVKPIYDASMHYQQQGVPLIVVAGKDYGMGSSRDWAAKGAALLGVRAVIAESFERIHRSNLVGMGVLPLCFQPGQSAAVLGLKGDEVFDIDLGEAGDIKPRQEVKVAARRPAGGEPIRFTAICRIDTPVEVDYYRNGGILQTVLRKMAKG